ncbi:sigma-70 family RNA polymerase sigma factor [Kaistia dalseonensis]|uniref:RNA polymerase sigma factor n=1 Tax=Kaistia dalseonensis TaxID=410840 RepID=A0ABU0HAF1_9HYPH|nr:sigma-70 family RNA polymerase sigma factor [Kaistia dalseonensis]MCX5495878.1 sigma-70 family RNA polymerase sigma factor [Kaistia dalseonensis]MDQ0438479.1 RNA polymerase sigma-70 factor (ECF subfamily) [Kaistia dalseonensis]
MTTDRHRFDIVGQLAPLRRYARSLTRDETDAEDLVQEALVRAYEKRESFRPERNLRAWLLSILHNIFVDRIRARRSEQLRIGHAGNLAPHSEAPPQDHAVRLAQVRQTFLALPEEQRAALHLVAIEGLSYAEAATTLAIPIGTLMSRLGRARATLRAIEDGPVLIERPDPTRIHHLKIVGGSDDTTD